METKSRNVSNIQEKGANINFEHVYSAQELGDLMNDNPLTLLELDMGYQTKWYNCDFIEEAMSFIGKEADMKMFMTLIVQSWRGQTLKQNPRVAYRDPKTRKLIPFVRDLNIKLDEICRRILSEREQLEEISSFRNLFRKQYGNPSALPDPSPREEAAAPTELSGQLKPTEVAPDNPHHIKIDDLTDGVRSKILLSQEQFDVFVKQLNEDTWLIVDGNRGLLCDCLRFVCIKHGIIASDTDRDTFDTLLHEVVKALENQPSLVSSMRRRNETAHNKIKRSLFCYDSPLKKHQDEVWQLVKDCKPIEESLQPVFEAMETPSFSE